MPPAPPAVPADLTRATARYKRHAWLAVAGLLGFVALYLSLTGWFCWTSARLFLALFHGDQNGFFDFVGGALSGLLGVFLLGALFFIKSGSKHSDLEVTADEEPELFAFLNALADRARAPRPHRVFLSMRVNAAVFYDLSLVNLLFPTKKNLEIGLGLVNTLNLSEMTAVLAHEFGHFAQRSMAVGRWVYVAQQVAGQIVASRSWLDRALAALSSIDLRVAWIGWLMRIIVWSIRSLLDTAFGLVILAQRALGREMEFQADLVSVSLAGSDALVHALHRLGAADSAWSHALGIAGREAALGHAVPDLFLLQTRIIQRMAGILNEPRHGASPELPAEGRAWHRVFEQDLAEPPRMWSTHPANRDREDNAKRVYVPAELDARPAFCLFADAERLRLTATARLLNDGREKPLELVSTETALAAVDKRFDRPHLAQRYRGAYLGRSIVLHEKSSSKLYGEPVPTQALRDELDQLYPETLAHDLRELRQAQQERVHLEALRDGVLDAPGGVIRHRGRVIQRRALVSVLAQVTSEIEAVQRRVEAHDRRCRSAHRAAARELGRGWEDYLCGLSALHHYAAHVEANLEDARGHLSNVYAIVTADGRVSSTERQRLVVASAEVHAVLWELFEQRQKVELPPPVLERLHEVMAFGRDEPAPATWSDVLPKNFALPPPSFANIAEFLGVVDSWVNGALGAVGALERVSLELLVETEAHVGHAYSTQSYAGVSPEPPVVPARYQTLARGQERSRQKRLGLWDRFQTADGFVASAARFLVATSILGGVLAFGGTIGHPRLTVVNGLQLPVVVELQGHRWVFEPHEHADVTVEPAVYTRLTTHTDGGEPIESMRVHIEGPDHYVYSVGGAVSLVEWTAVYGSTSPVPERRLGAPTWFKTAADIVFEDPPKSLSASSDGNKKTVLSALLEQGPYRVTDPAKQSEEPHIIEMHALWDAPSSPHLIEWLGALSDDAHGTAVVQQRLRRYPDDISALRVELDRARGAHKQALCQRAQAKAENAPNDLNLRYLALACEDDSARVAEQALQAYRDHPQHPYLAALAGRELMRRRDYMGASMAFTTASSAAALSDGANLALARLLRIRGQEALDVRLTELAEGSSSLRQLLALERGEQTEQAEGAEQAFSFLAKGELERAVSTAAANKDVYHIVLPLAAASDGASRGLVETALAELGAVREASAAWATIALAEREGRAHAELDAALKRTIADAPLVLRFADAEFLERDPAAVEAELWKLSAESQPMACMVALVRAAERAPGPCRSFVKAWLFASERPYFR